MNSPTSLKKKAHFANGKGNQPDTNQHFQRSSLEGEVQRHTYYARVDLLEKLQGYAYWEQFGISELINHILEEFFEGKEVKPCPPQNSRCRWKTGTTPKRNTR